MTFSTCIKAVLATLILSTSAYSYQVVEDLCPLVTKNPRLQDQKTHKILLDNGIQVYLVSDPDRQQSAASFGMRVGSWQDPKAYPGTAHFVEHLLFMGSHTYPNEELFMQSIDKAGGTTNAYTSTDKTVYGFSSDNEHFEAIFDIFAHMFMDPLFNPDTISREYKAVEQEYQLSLTKDNWRFFAVLKALGDPDHPHNAFSCGNSETLAKIPVQTAIDWYKRHYQPEKGVLVLTSPLPLEVMANMVETSFGQIKSTNETPEAVSTPATLFKPDLFPAKIHIPPYEQETQEIILLWELPPSYNSTLPSGKNASHVMLYHTLAGNHEGSLQHKLKRTSLITEASSWIYQVADNTHLFSLSFTLTDKGVAEREQVIQQVDAYLKTLTTLSMPMYFPEEIATIWENQRSITARAHAFSFCMDYAAKLLHEPLPSFPLAHEGLASFDEKGYIELIENLQLDKALQLYVMTPEKVGINTTKLEKWYQVPYEVVPAELAQKTATSTSEFIPFPGPNPYIASKVQPLAKPEYEAPTKATWLIDKPKEQLIYWEDDTFLLPKVALEALIESHHIDLSAKSDLYLELFETITNKNLNHLNVQGGIAGIGIGVAAQGDGIGISLSGFSEKSLPFFIDGLAIITDLNTTDEAFDVAKESLKANLNNEKFSPPFRQSLNHLHTLTSNHGHSNDTYLAALEGIQKEDFIEFMGKVLSQSSLKMAISGALSKDRAHTFYRALRNHNVLRPKLALEALPEPIKKQSLALDGESLPEKTYLACTEKGAVAILRIQDSDFSFSKLASNYLLNYALKGEFFETLRTKQQTGYLAAAFPHKTDNDLLSHNFVVQSTTHSSEELLARYELFLEEFVAKIEEHIPPKQFTDFKATLDNQISIPHETIASKNSELFYGLVTYQGDLDRKEKLLAANKALGYDEFINWSKALLSRTNHKRLAILTGSTQNEADFVYIEKGKHDVSVKEFKPSEIVK